MSAKQSTAERPSWVAHFFASADQQKSAANFGNPKKRTTRPVNGAINPVAASYIHLKKNAMM